MNTTWAPFRIERFRTASLSVFKFLSQTCKSDIQVATTDLVGWEYSSDSVRRRSSVATPEGPSSSE